MDILTQSLAAIALSNAGLKRACPRAVWLLLGAANIAEFDSAARLAGVVAYWNLSRSALHSVVAAPFLALMIAALARLPAKAPYPWRRSFGVALTGSVIPLVGEWAGNEGARLLWPFSDRWFRAGFLPDWDLWVLIPMLGALFFPWLLGVAVSEMGAKKGSGSAAAVFMLCVLAAVGFGRFLLHQRAVATLESRLYEGEAPERVGALALPVSPFRWLGIVEGDGFIRVYRDLKPLEDFDPRQGQAFLKPEPREEMERARQTPAFRAFLNRHAWTLWRVTPLPNLEGGIEVELRDLVPGRPQGSPQVKAVFDAAGRLTSVTPRL